MRLRIDLYGEHIGLNIIYFGLPSLNLGSVE